MGTFKECAAGSYVLITPKLAFFFMYTGYGCILPFMNIFLMSVGLCPTQVGFITGLRTIPQVIAAPIWGIIADKTRRHQLIAVLLYIGAICAMLPQPWIASALSPIAQHPPLDKSVSKLHATQLELKNNSDMVAGDSMIKECSGSTASLFRAMMIMAMTFAVFDSAMIGMIETITMGRIRYFRVETSFGRQRVFGSLGFGLAAVINSGAADLLHIPGLSPFTPLFFIYSLAMLSLAILSHFLYKNSREILYSLDGSDEVEHNEGQTSSVPRSSVMKAYLDTVTKFSTVFFFVTVLLMGMANGLYFGYMPAYLEHMKAPRIIVGLSIIVSSVGELIIFPVSASFINFLGGEMAAMGVATIAYAFRFFAVSVMQTPWMLIAIQTINVVAFPLFWAACIQHTHKISCKDISTSMFTTINGIHFGAGTLVSNTLGGLLFDKFGGKMLFRFTSLIYMAWPLVIGGYIVMSRCRTKRNRYERVGP